MEGISGGAERTAAWRALQEMEVHSYNVEEMDKEAVLEVGNPLWVPTENSLSFL